MDAKKMRIRILDIQDEYCQNCECQMKPLKHCIQHCEQGRELSNLAKGIIQLKRVRNTRKEWDDICQQAAALYKQGIKLPMIAEKLSCHKNTLRDQLKKRGLWKGPTQLEIQEQTQKKWDYICQQALKLKNQGLSYPQIAKHLEVPASNLRNQMSKRGIR